MESVQNKSSLLDTVQRKQFFIQAAFATAFSYLTSGVFLSGFAILVGAGDVLVSYLSVIINICGVVILFFSSFMERFKSRKRLAIGLTAGSRIATLLIVCIPAFVPQKAQLPLFLSSVIIAFTLQAQTTVVLNQWMFTYIDEKKSGRYISLRQTMTLAVTVLCSLAGGWWMDFIQGKYMGFVVLFSIALLFGIADIFILSRIPEGMTQQSANRNCTLGELMKLPLKDRHFTGFVLYIFGFYLLLNVGDSFTMVYMMKYLALPYQTVTGMYLIISLPQVLLLGLWGKISDKYGHGTALKASIWLFAGETLFMFFASPQSCYVFIPIAFFIASVANAGFVVAVLNRRYELMPRENRIIYDNFYTAVIGVAFILGPMLGGVLKKTIESITVLEEAIPFGNIRLLYVISTVGILLLQVIYHNIHKEGGRKPCQK